MVRDQHAVDVGFEDAREGTEDFGDFGRRDIFGFPAVGVAEAVEEEPAAVVGAAQGVAGAVVEVALFEHVAGEPLGCCFGRVFIAGEDGLVGDGDEDFATDGVGLADCVAGGRVAEDVVGGMVDGDGDEDVVVDAADEGAVVADGVGEVGASAPVDGCEDAFGAAEEFGDFLYAEAGAEALPDVGSKAVAVHEAHFVLFVEWARGRREEVAGGFADVDEGGRFGVADVRPEIAGGEGFADGDGDPAHKICEGRDTAGAVV